jgi:hypothetical protein
MTEQSKNPAEDWAARAAGLILNDLQGRKGIGNELDNIDQDILLEIIDTMAEFIRQSARTASPGEQAEPETQPIARKEIRPDNRIRKAIQVFSAATSQPMDEFELKDAFVDLIEGVLANDATQIYILAQPTGELEVRARVNRKVHTLYTAATQDALGALCATIVAAGRDRVPYLPSRPFESIITQTSIDEHGLRFPEPLRTIHALIEPLSIGFLAVVKKSIQTYSSAIAMLTQCVST